MRHDKRSDDALERAACAIRSAQAILIGAGAGMGVDSGQKVPPNADDGSWSLALGLVV